MRTHFFNILQLSLFDHDLRPPTGAPGHLVRLRLPYRRCTAHLAKIVAGAAA